MYVGIYWNVKVEMMRIGRLMILSALDQATPTSPLYFTNPDEKVQTWKFAIAALYADDIFVADTK